MLRFLLFAILVVASCGRIRAGDGVARHWSYQPPRQAALPQVHDRSWPRNAIDYFILEQMESAGVRPSPEAERATLARRLSHDLLGLPLSLAELDQFLSDSAPDAYERLVDRLLASPRFGERMARLWLDLARYADTHGYLIDAHRDMWRWRDWVIQAYNDDIGFDQFTTEQLAGDLLRQPTLSQQIASGFHRNHMVNYENGAIPEEYRVEYVADRVETTGTVWLGQTLACARCHDHKYDPFTMRDYYQLFAFFNNVPEVGLDGHRGNALPLIKAPTDEQLRRMEAQQARIDQLQRELERRRREALDTLPAWESSLAGERPAAPAPRDSAATAAFDSVQDGKTPVTRANDTVFAALIAGTSTLVPGRNHLALLFDGETRVDLPGVPLEPRSSGWSVSVWIFPTTADELDVLEYQAATSQESVRLTLDRGHVGIRFQLGQGANLLAVRTASKLATHQWQHLLMQTDGTALAGGVQVFVDGKLVAHTVESDGLSRPVAGNGTWHLGGLAAGRRFRGLMDDFRIFARPMSPREAASLAGQNALDEILATPVSARTAVQRLQLCDIYLARRDPDYEKLSNELAATQRQLEDERKAVPTTMVMQELPEARETWLLLRGEFDQHGERVEADTPAALPPFGAERPRNRLGLAQWLLDSRNPLTARVAVNRAWQHFLGEGLVRTGEDFGTRGEPPTHPALLDWLSVEFRREGWKIKQLARWIVTSASYRQSSRMRTDLLDRDPENRLWARASRHRQDAESIRDAALFTAGLLDNRIGGPPVYPYQPPGLWEEVSYNPGEFSAQSYVQSHGRDLYRRSIYTFWKRTLPPPSMLVFDAPTRETCTVQRSRSNTPLQALVLMNDPGMVESARKLAERVLLEHASCETDLVRTMFRHVTGRWPADVESRALVELTHRQRERFQREPSRAEALLKVGEAPRAAGLNVIELAAWTCAASVVLTSDESMTRE